nr:HAMP domain-containing protein [Rhodothermaceae bacterium]
EPYTPSYGSPASFIASPIVDNGSLIGVLSFQMPVDNINKVMTGDGQWSERGLGHTGETYLIGSDFTMRSIARELTEAPESYFKNLETAGVNDETKHDIQAFGTSILLQPVKTDASNAVMNGVAGAQIIDNYHGESVLSSYRPLEIDGVNWAIIAEIHKQEAFQGIQAFVLLMALSGLSVLCIAFFAALQFAKSFTRPIVELKNAACRVAEGDDSVSLTVVRKDEFGSLATAFNQMTSSIRDSKTALEKERDAIQQRVDQAVEVAQNHHVYMNAQVSRMLEAMNQFSRGDLTVSLQGTKADEIASLFDGFTRAIGNIRVMLQSAKDGAVVAQKTADKINGIMEGVLTDSNKQASRAEETTSAVTKLVETVRHNAQSTTTLSSTAKKCSKVSESGGKILHRMVDQMQQISEDVFAAEEIIQSLGASGQEIGGIINVIADIADQTNLLALNAAIEAARAGEQGKGFAVVADEVRKLAERTSSSTREIMNMIQGIQAETNAAIEAMSKGRKRVSDGLSMANRARESLEDINDIINLLVTKVYQIASATEDQAAMSSQITESVNSILSGARNSAEHITESVKAVEKLYLVNEELSQNLDEFVLRTAQIK